MIALGINAAFHDSAAALVAGPSALIPFLSVYRRARGALRFRVLFP